MWGWRSSRTLVVGIALAAFVLVCFVPIAYMVAVSFGDPNRTTSLYRAWFLDSRQRGLLFNTALLGGGTAVAASLLGGPLGIALARVALPFKPGFRILLA